MSISKALTEIALALPLLFTGFAGNLDNTEAAAAAAAASFANPLQVSHPATSAIRPDRTKAGTEKQQPLTFVLIHGAWSDADFWSGTAEELRKQGHQVYVPEYAGHGKQYNPDVTHEQIVQSVVDYIAEHKLKNIILVGHSFGGSVVQKVAEQIPDRIHRLVFFDAFVVPDGQSVLDQLPPAAQQAFTELSKTTGNRTFPMPFPLFRETFVNTANLSLAKDIYKSAKPEPAGPVVQKLDLKKFYSLDLPRSYLYLTSDTAVPQGEYGFHPTQSSHLGVFRLIKGRGDHMTTAYAHPDYLAHKLYKAARD